MDSNLLSLWTGAAIALIGSVLAPLIQDWVKDARSGRNEHREQRRKEIAHLRDAAMLAMVHAPLGDEEQSAEHLEAVRRLVVAIYRLDLRIGPRPNQYVRNALMSLTGAGREEVSERQFWMRYMESLWDLEVLVEKPERYENAIELVNHYFAIDTVLDNEETEDPRA